MDIASARTFQPTKGGQSLIADRIAQGATGTKGLANAEGICPWKSCATPRQCWSLPRVEIHE